MYSVIIFHHCTRGGTNAPPIWTGSQHRKPSKWGLKSQQTDRHKHPKRCPYPIQYCVYMCIILRTVQLAAFGRSWCGLNKTSQLPFCWVRPTILATWRIGQQNYHQTSQTLGCEDWGANGRLLILNHFDLSQNGMWSRHNTDESQHWSIGQSTKTNFTLIEATLGLRVLIMATNICRWTLWMPCLKSAS